LNHRGTKAGAEKERGKKQPVSQLKKGTKIRERMREREKGKNVLIWEDVTEEQLILFGTDPEKKFVPNASSFS